MGTDFRLLRLARAKRAYAKYVVDITHDGYEPITFDYWLKLEDEGVFNTGMEKYYKRKN